MKTFWLYYGELIVGGFRGTDGEDAKRNALEQFSQNPFLFNDWVTRGHISHAIAKE